MNAPARPKPSAQSAPPAPIDYAQAWTLLDIARLAEMRIMQEDAPPGAAEIVPDTPAQWLLVRTLPGEDLRALRWLARRRFGAFRPMQQRVDRKSGRRLQGLEPVFPGWLFVFCWPSRANFARILCCPGVASLLCDPASGRPIDVDEALLTTDKRACVFPRAGFIDRLRALAWVYDENAPVAGRHAAVTAGRHAKRTTARLTPAQRRILKKLTVTAQAADIWDQEEWAHANLLAPGKRISLLMRALNKPRR